LAKRIEARVYALLVLPGAVPTGGEAIGKDLSNIRQRFELLIEMAKSEGIAVEYFVSEGNYEEEVIRFVEHNRITLLVAEASDGENRCTERGARGIRKILHRITCKVELVSPRKPEAIHL